MIIVQLNRISLIVKWLHLPCPAISVDLRVANESFPQRLWMEEEQICGKPAFCNALGTMPGCLFTATKTKLSDQFFQFLLGITVVLREIEDNAETKF